MSISGQGHSLTLVKGHLDFKVKCLNFGLYTQVSDSGPLGPLVSIYSPGGHLIQQSGTVWADLVDSHLRNIPVYFFLKSMHWLRWRSQLKVFYF